MPTARRQTGEAGREHQQGDRDAGRPRQQQRSEVAEQEQRG
jgi:hypothetical protein